MFSEGVGWTWPSQSEGRKGAGAWAGRNERKKFINIRQSAIATSVIIKPEEERVTWPDNSSPWAASTVTWGRAPVYLAAVIMSGMVFTYIFFTLIGKVTNFTIMLIFTHLFISRRARNGFPRTMNLSGSNLSQRLAISHICPKKWQRDGDVRKPIQVRNYFLFCQILTRQCLVRSRKGWKCLPVVVSFMYCFKHSQGSSIYELVLLEVYMLCFLDRPCRIATFVENLSSVQTT